MNYILEELISDKELRKSLVDGIFTFSDEKGDFFAVDFENESMRQNHITTFEVLYSIGGDALFENILQEGNTCLTNDPDAAKVGIKEIAGAKGWYLKTNASAFNAFSSILYGLSALGDNARFTFTTVEETTSYKIVSKALENYSTGLEFGFEDVYKVEKNEDGSFGVIYAEDGKTVTFLTIGLNGNREISNFKILEPITVFCEEYNEEDDEYKEHEKAVAYKFKLEENGKWGFFNAEFSQFIPPMFDGVLITTWEKGKKLIAYEIIENWNFTDNNSFDSLGVKDYYLYFSDNGILEFSNMKITMSYACCVPAEFSPAEQSIVDKMKLLKEDKEVVFYSSGGNPNSGFLFIKDKVSYSQLGFGKKTLTGNRVIIEKKVLKGDNTKKALAIAENGVASVEDFMKLYSEEQFSYRAVERLYQDTYIVERDGYFGIAKMSKPKSRGFGGFESVLELDEMITPYAFTGVTLALQDCVIVDRFGKKGLFRISDKKYVIPCDFDELVSLGWNKYKVNKADFTGIVQVGLESYWIEKLHREE